MLKRMLAKGLLLLILGVVALPLSFGARKKVKRLPPSPFPDYIIKAGEKIERLSLEMEKLVIMVEKYENAPALDSMPEPMDAFDPESILTACRSESLSAAKMLAQGKTISNKQYIGDFSKGLLEHQVCEAFLIGNPSPCKALKGTLYTAQSLGPWSPDLGDTCDQYYDWLAFSKALIDNKRGTKKLCLSHLNNKIDPAKDATQGGAKFDYPIRGHEKKVCDEFAKGTKDLKGLTERIVMISYEMSRVERVVSKVVGPETYLVRGPPGGDIEDARDDISILLGTSTKCDEALSPKKDVCLTSKLYRAAAKGGSVSLCGGKVVCKAMMGGGAAVCAQALEPLKKIYCDIVVSERRSNYNAEGAKRNEEIEEFLRVEQNAESRLTTVIELESRFYEIRSEIYEISPRLRMTDPKHPDRKALLRKSRRATKRIGGLERRLKKALPGAKRFDKHGGRK